MSSKDNFIKLSKFNSMIKYYKYKKKYQINDKKICSFIFNVKYNKNNSVSENLDYTIKWFMKHYPTSKYDYFLVEQDVNSNFNFENLKMQKIFLYNPNYFNRGWSFNVAVKNYVSTDVVVFCDSDIILENPKNIEKAINMCLHSENLVSPYKYVKYTNEKERKKILNGNLSLIRMNSKHPVTVSGGIAVVNRASFLKIGGFEEYITYGGEDRSLDVLYDKFFNYDMIDGYGIHLFHKTNNLNKKYFLNMLSHLEKNYKCIKVKQSPYMFIHDKCNHSSRESLEKIVEKKIKYFGDPTLYNSNRKKFINGIPI